MQKMQKLQRIQKMPRNAKNTKNAKNAYQMQLFLKKVFFDLVMGFLAKNYQTLNVRKIRKYEEKVLIRFFETKLFSSF